MIVAIDPGGTTGIAIYFMNPVRLETLNLAIADVMAWLNESDFRNEDEFVIERFATAGRLSRYGLETIDLVGQVKGWCLAKGISCTVQSPASRKGWQRQADSYPSINLVHERDALAHLLQYLEMKKGITI